MVSSRTDFLETGALKYVSAGKQQNLFLNNCLRRVNGMKTNTKNWQRDELLHNQFYCNAPARIGLEKIDAG